MTASPVGALSTSFFLGPRNFYSTETTVDPIVVEAVPTEFLRVPKAFLLDADFVRQGADLLLVSADGGQLVVRDYFALSRPPALHTEEGAVLPADLVQSLAGPAAPAQYAQLEPQAIAAPIGRVATIEGTVTATRSDGTVVQLAVDAPVLQGDVLETGSNSRVGLVFNDDTTFALGENARMVLDEFIYDPSTHEGISAVSVVKGVFVFVSGQIAAHNPEEMVVRTPTTVIGIRGTKVAGKAAAEGENSTFVLLPDEDGTVGAIVVRTFVGELLIDVANASVVVRSAFLPPERVQLSNIEFNSLFASVLQALPASPDVIREDESGAEDLGFLELSPGGMGPMETMMGVEDDEILAGGIADDVLGLGLDEAILGGEIVSVTGEDLQSEADSEIPDRNEELAICVDEDGAFCAEEEVQAPPESSGPDFVINVADEGDNVIRAGTGDEFFILGGGNDEFLGNIGSDTVLGGFGDDIASGGSGNDVLFGDSGNDVLNGDEGNDTLRGGADSDTLFGGVGDDFLNGDGGDDSQIGGEGNDTLDGSGGSDTLSGGTGNDSLLGGGDNDTLSGDGGNDTLDGGAGDDFVQGGEGNDVVGGGSGNDTLLGGDGDDSIVGGSGEGDDFLDGGPGINTAIYSSAVLPISVNLNSFAFSFLQLGVTNGDPDEIGDDFLLNIQNIIGGSGDDTILGDFGPNHLAGGPGDDSIDGSFGNDTVDGDGGSDSLLGGQGDDLVRGGDDDDSLSGGEGNDTVEGDGGNDSLMGGQGDDLVRGGDGDDSLLGSEGNDTLEGGDGDDLFLAGSDLGDDTFSGGGSVDVVSYETSPFPVFVVSGDPNSGGEAPVVINTGFGTDTILDAEMVIGSAQTDFVSFTAPNGGEFDGGGGTDLLLGGSGPDTLLGGAGPDIIDGGNGDDSLAGNDGADRVFGQGGNDSIDGGNGSDLLRGEVGDDTIHGGFGNDFIDVGGGFDQAFGDGGADTIVGGSQSDSLFGGSGNDSIMGGNGVNPSDSDFLSGDDGDDSIVGDAAGDQLMGGNGIDTLLGAAGNDSLFGGTGADLLFGGDDGDTLSGGAGDDTLDGELGDDLLSGGDDNDSLLGGEGADELNGDAGDDSLIGEAGEDTLSGDLGDDSLMGEADADVLSGGDGNDTLEGGDGDDTLSGDLGGDMLFGQAGNDDLNGDEENDTLEGGEGDDNLDGGEGDGDVASYGDATGSVTVDVEMGTAMDGGRGRHGFSDCHRKCDRWQIRGHPDWRR